MAKTDYKENFFAFTTTRPVAIVMIVTAVLIFGFLSYQSLSLSLMPDISYPSLTVRTEYEGAAPEEVETTISRPIEEALGVVTNLVTISSVSKAGQSDVILEFNWDTEMNEAINEVREKLDRVFLPDDAEKPLILKFDPSLDPIIRLGLSGGEDLYRDRYIAEEQIKRELETLDGVASVKVKGGYEEEIRVELNEKQITLLGLDIQQIRQRLSQENVNLAGGEIREGPTEFIVRTLNEFRTIAEIGDIRLGISNGRDIRLRDIGNVYRTHKERQIITRLNGVESVELEVYKEGDANIVEVARTVKDRVFGTAEQQAYVANMDKKKTEQAAETQVEKPAQPGGQGGGRGRGGPGGGGPNPEEILKQRMTDYLVYKYRDDATLGLLTDQSVFIRNAIDEVKNTAVLGGVFAVIVLLLFLNNFSTTLIVAASIPVSIIATFAPMRLFDVSLNIMSLGGLALGVGMLVDNAIVVTESIFRCREDGDGFVESVIRGTSEVGGAVTASTLTTIAVFFPMIFVEGVAGQIFGDLSVTIVFSLLASLAAALFFIPMLASRKVEFGKRQENGATLMSLFTNLVSWTNLKTLWSSARQRWSRRKTFSKWSYGLLFWLITIIYALLRFAVHTAVLIIIKIYGLVLLIFSLTVGFIGLLLNKTVVPAMNFLTGKFNKGVDHLTERYTRVIRWALANRMSVIMMALLPFLVAVFILLPRLGSELIPEVRQGEFYLQLSFPIGTPVETTAELIDPIERYILDDGDVEKISTVAGVDLSKITDSESGEHTAQLTVKLNENAGSPVEVEDRVLERIRTYLADFSGLTYQVSRPVLFSFKTPIEVEIEGYNLADLSSASRQAVQALSQIPGVTDVKSNVQRGNPEVQIIYDRVRLAHFGLNVLDVANLVRNKVRGDVATEFKKEDRRIDVRVKIRDEDKETIDRLRSLNIAPQSEYPIPLEAVAKIEISEGPSEIRRIDQQRTAVIMANIVGRDLASVSDDVYAVMNNLDLPRDFRFEIAGQNKEMEVSLNSLKLALLLAIFMVYVVMASQFESFLHPLVILFTVPFALIGVVLVLFVMGIPLNIMVFLGIIMLAGIVVNNAIVLVDYINQLRREGMEKEAAIVKAGQARLRPILMTTATTVLGLLPMALGLGEGAEIRTPMAITVIAGLISATFLTLVVIPTVYAIMERKEKLEPTTMV